MTTIQAVRRETCRQAFLALTRDCKASFLLTPLLVQAAAHSVKDCQTNVQRHLCTEREQRVSPLSLPTPTRILHSLQPDLDRSPLQQY